MGGIGCSTFLGMTRLQQTDLQCLLVFLAQSAWPRPRRFFDAQGIESSTCCSLRSCLQWQTDLQRLLAYLAQSVSPVKLLYLVFLSRLSTGNSKRNRTKC